MVDYEKKSLEDGAALVFEATAVFIISNLAIRQLPQ